jgi:hypothetical protein
VRSLRRCPVRRCKVSAAGANGPCAPSNVAAWATATTVAACSQAGVDYTVVAKVATRTSVAACSQAGVDYTTSPSALVSRYVAACSQAGVDYTCALPLRMAYIRLLYDVEDAAKEQFAQQAPAARRPLSAFRLALRQERTVPRLQQFRAWLQSQQAQQGGPVLPKSPLGEAITYAFNQWDALTVYTTDGDLAIDNNASENALRRVALGRRNWLFCGSDNGGHTGAILFSLIATCQRHHVEPFTYLRDVLTRIAAHPMSRLAELLPATNPPS